MIFDPSWSRSLFFYDARFAVITNLHLYDGPTQVKAFDGLSLTGDHSTGIDSSNSWQIDPPITILFGLGNSVGMRFPPVTHIPSQILFTTAGADFITP